MRVSHICAALCVLWKSSPASHFFVCVVASIMVVLWGSRDGAARDVVESDLFNRFVPGGAMVVLLCCFTSRRRLRAKVRAVDGRMCVRCGYERLATDAGRCPECGDPTPVGECREAWLKWAKCWP